MKIQTIACCVLFLHGAALAQSTPKPTLPTQPANKAYVDAVAAGLVPINTVAPLTGITISTPTFTPSCPVANCVIEGQHGGHHPTQAANITQGRTSLDNYTAEWLVVDGLYVNTGQGSTARGSGQKVTHYIGAVQGAHGGTTWAGNSDIACNGVPNGSNGQVASSSPGKPGAIPAGNGCINWEFDYTNWNGDDGVGRGSFAVDLYLHNASKYASLAGIYFDSKSELSHNFAWHYGIYLAGDDLIGNVGFYDSSKSPMAFGASNTHTQGFGTVSTNTDIYDFYSGGTNTGADFEASNTTPLVFDCTNATTSKCLEAAAGQAVALNGANNAFVYNTANTRINLTGATGATNYSFGDNGQFYAYNGAIVGTKGLVAGGNGAVGSHIVINGAAANKRSLVYDTAGVTNWTCGLDAAAQGGSNAGANFACSAYSDAGTLLATPFTMKRATGLAAFANGLIVVGGLAADTITTTGPIINGSQETAAPVTGASVTMANCDDLFLNPAATLAALTVVLPATHPAGCPVSITSSQAITALTISSPAGINGNIASMAANTTWAAKFVAAFSVWQRTNKPS